MGKYSKIERKIWGDADFRGWGDDGQLAFLFLLTHPAQTAVGAFAHTLAGLAAEKRWPEKRLRKALAPALAKGSVKVDEDAGLIVLPKWLQHNEPESPSVVKAWGAAVAALPECALRDELRGSLRAYLEARGGGWLKACPTVLRWAGSAAAEEAGDYAGRPAGWRADSGAECAASRAVAVAGTRTVTSNGGEAAAVGVPLVTGQAVVTAAPAAPLGDLGAEGNGNGALAEAGGTQGPAPGKSTAGRFSALDPAFRARWDALAEVLRGTPLKLTRRDVGRVIAFGVGYAGGRYAACPAEFAFLLLSCLVDVGAKQHQARPSDKVRDPVAYAMQLLESRVYTPSPGALAVVKPAWARAEALVAERIGAALGKEAAAERAELAKVIEAELAKVG